MILTLFVGAAVNAGGTRLRSREEFVTKDQPQHREGAPLSERRISGGPGTAEPASGSAASTFRGEAVADPGKASEPSVASVDGLPLREGTGDPLEEEQRRVERLLLERAQQGDLAAYGELVRRYQARVLTVAYGILRNREDAEDVVQDGFLKAFRNLSNFRGQSSFYTWLYRIVFNLSIDLSRKKYRRTEVNSGDSLTIDAHLAKDESRGGSPEVVIGKVAGPAEQLNRKELQGKIAEAMNALSADHRAVVMLREFDGLSYAEIAEAVGCTKGTVMSRLHHARRRLQRILAEFAPAGAVDEGSNRQTAKDERAEGDARQGELS